MHLYLPVFRFENTFLLRDLNQVVWLFFELFHSRCVACHQCRKYNSWCCFYIALQLQQLMGCPSSTQKSGYGNICMKLRLYYWFKNSFKFSTAPRPVSFILLVQIQLKNSFFEVIAFCLKFHVIIWLGCTWKIFFQRRYLELAYSPNQNILSLFLGVIFCFEMLYDEIFDQTVKQRQFRYCKFRNTKVLYLQSHE